MFENNIPDFTGTMLQNGLIEPEVAVEFCNIIQDFYSLNGRLFTWRQQPTPYQVMVSEIMLQQTQTYRVEPKYARFIDALPDFEVLATASQREVLSLWQGLGYNRRGLALHQCAQKVMQEHGGLLPSDPTLLETFPGIGKATAASIVAFAFNRPTVFIETNIRAVYLYLFFRNQEDIADKKLMPLIEQTVDHGNPRHWYYALMDYGVMLKKQFPNPSRKSKHHTQQSKFEGSERQIRGQIIKILTAQETATFENFCALINRSPERIQKNLDKLVQENMVKKQANYYCL